jgi:hypothetical protein
MKLIDKYKQIQKIGTETFVPHAVWRLFSSKRQTISISGSDICLGEDYASLKQARFAIGFYVDQLGGKVKWEKETNENK